MRRVGRLASWMLVIGCALGGVALVVATPSDATYWLSTFMVLPLIVGLSVSVAPRWAGAPRWVQRAAWAGAFALAVAGGALYVFAPSGASYAVGGLMVLPLIALMAGTSDQRQPAPGEPVDGPWGLP